MSSKSGTPSKSKRAMSSGSWRSGGSAQFQTQNPFETQATAVNASGSAGSYDSNGSPGASVSSTDTVTGKGIADAIATPPRAGQGQAPAQTPNSSQAFRGLSPVMSRRMSAASQNIPSSFSSPIRKVAQGSPNNNVGFGARRSSAVSNGPVYVPPPLRRDSQGSLGSLDSPSRHSTSSNHGPPTLHPSVSVMHSMYGIPEIQAVEEMAFRRGQQDRGNARNRMPKNPFGPRYNEVWATCYKDGKASTLETRLSPTNPPSPSRENHAWSNFINPWTQSQEHPNGSYDEAWVRDTCIRSLRSMQTLISLVCKRNKEWDRVVCDVPAPVAQTLPQFPDLLEWYQVMQHDAREALGGGRPQGY